MVVDLERPTLTEKRARASTSEDYLTEGDFDGERQHQDFPDRQEPPRCCILNDTDWQSVRFAGDRRGPTSDLATVEGAAASGGEIL